MNISIRDAQLADAAAIVQLLNQLAAIEEEQSSITEQYVAHYLSSPISHILVAEVDQRVVGLLSYSLRPDLYHAAKVCLIEELVVEEHARGQGVGGALITELLSQLRTIGCAEVSVAAMPDNARAIHFYRTHGLIEEAVLLEKHF